MSGLIRVEFVSPEAWDRRDELDRLLYDVMYREFGVAPDGPWRDTSAETALAVALDPDETLLGSARLLAAPDGTGASRQVRQVVVAPDARHHGVGRALMTAVEWLAAQECAEEVTLHARDTAVAFYERLSYERVSEEWVSELTGIPHTTMRKSLR